MTCELIEKNSICELQRAINSFISNKQTVEVSISTLSDATGYGMKAIYIACILYQ